MQERQIEVRLRLFFQAVVLTVFHDADDLERRLVAGDAERLIDRVAIGPEAPGHRLVDDANAGRILRVEVVEVASLQYRDRHRLEEICADGVVIDRQNRVGRRFVARNLHGDLLLAAAAERNDVSEARGFHARKFAETLGELLVVALPALLIVALQPDVRGNRGQLLRLETRIAVLRIM